jgi:hypothetical protein
LFVYLFFSFLYLLIYLFTFPCSSSLLIMSNKKNRQLRGVCLSVCCVYWYVTPLSVGETDYDKIWISMTDIQPTSKIKWTIVFVSHSPKYTKSGEHKLNIIEINNLS